MCFCPLFNGFFVDFRGILHGWRYRKRCRRPQVAEAGSVMLFDGPGVSGVGVLTRTCAVVRRDGRLFAHYVALEDDLGGEVVGIAVEEDAGSISALGIALASAFGVTEEFVVVDY